MSTIVSTGDFDYTELTHTYMEIFDSHAFYQFLNTTQTGFAHTSSGTELSLLLKTIFTSLMLCTIQLTMFCCFRNIFTSLYQPRCHCVPINERIDPLPKGFVNWILPTLLYSIHHYLSLGLDAYFFIRYINILLLFFIIIGSLNMVILIPINAFGSNGEFSATGLDKWSLSNISSSKVNYLNAHLIMSLLTIGFFHCLIIYEMECVVKIRQSYLFSSKHRTSVISKTLLIKNVPNSLLDLNSLSQAFSGIPGGVKNIWFVNEYKNIDNSIKQANEAITYLELGEIMFLKQYHRKYSGENYEYEIFDRLSSLRPFFYPPIHIKHKFPYLNLNLKFSLPGFFRSLLFQPRVDQIKWSLNKLKEAKLSIETEKIKLSSGSLRKYNSVFIQFNTQAGTYIAYQCLLYESQGFMDKALIEVHPKDIQWNNVTQNNTIVSLVQKYLLSLLCIILIILYVIPVSFIGLISQIPLLTKLMPFLNWIYALPEETRKSISSILPSMLLTILTEFIMITFRFLTYYKGKLSGSEIELDLQRWYFGFLFIQQFLVVTISSSVIVILKQIVDQPTSIPVMLATNIPKSAIFFFQFIAVKALAFCGNNFLRIDQLILRNSFYKLIDITPRMKFNRLTNLLKIKWGTVYPVYSVYASIGLTYTTISPLISLFIIFILSLVLLYYKYSLRYIYSHINESESHGRLYASALFHLYSGIYCLECCLIGIFFLSKNQLGKFPLRCHGWLMSGILVATIFGNITIYKRYSKHFYYLPLIHEKLEIDDDGKSDLSLSRNPAFISNFKMLYLHPNFKFEVPKIWLPKDNLNVSQQEIIRISKEGIEGTATEAACISFSIFNLISEIKISDAPPEYK